MKKKKQWGEYLFYKVNFRVWSLISSVLKPVMFGCFHSATKGTVLSGDNTTATWAFFSWTAFSKNYWGFSWSTSLAIFFVVSFFTLIKKLQQLLKFWWLLLRVLCRWGLEIPNHNFFMLKIGNFDGFPWSAYWFVHWWRPLRFVFGKFSRSGCGKECERRCLLVLIEK